MLDSRQKALKVTANALYGFTGAGVMPRLSAAVSLRSLTCFRLAWTVTHSKSEKPLWVHRRRCYSVLSWQTRVWLSGRRHAGEPASSHISMPLKVTRVHPRPQSINRPGLHVLMVPPTLGGPSLRPDWYMTDRIASPCGTGKLGEVGRTARVIYAQTDSIFMHVPDATAVQAIDVGKQLAKLVSAAFPKPMELKFENVSWPFMLLHVNRCAENP